MSNCESCGVELDEDDDSSYCESCAEELSPPPSGTECEFCGEKEATVYLQDHAVCDDCYSDAVESLIED